MADTRIAMMGQPVNVMLPSEALSNAYNLKKSQMQSDAMAGEMRDNALMDQAYRASGGDLSKMQSDPRMGFSGGMKVAGMRADIAKANKAERQGEIDYQIKAAEYGGSLAAAANDQNSWNAVVAHAKESMPPEMFANFPKEFSPQARDQVVAGSMSAKDRYAMQRDEMRYAQQDQRDQARFYQQMSMQNASFANQANLLDRRLGADNSEKVPKIVTIEGQSFEQLPDGSYRKPMVGGAPVSTKVSAADKKLLQSMDQSSRDAEDSNALILQAEALLPKATGSMAGKARDVVLGAGGYSTDASEAATQLKIIGGGLVSKVPKMSGPQSDADVRLYREMAGQVADESQPIGNRMAALKTLKEINQRQIDYKKTALDLRPELHDSGLGGGNEPQKPSYWDRMSPEHQKAWLEDQN